MTSLASTSSFADAFSPASLPPMKAPMPCFDSDSTSDSDRDMESPDHGTAVELECADAPTRHDDDDAVRSVAASYSPLVPPCLPPTDDVFQCYLRGRAAWDARRCSATTASYTMDPYYANLVIGWRAKLASGTLPALWVFACARETTCLLLLFYPLR